MSKKTKEQLEKAEELEKKICPKFKKMLSSLRKVDPKTKLPGTLFNKNKS